MLAKLCFLSLALPALTSPIIGAWEITTEARVKRAPIFENVTGIPPLENITGNPHPETSAHFSANSTLKKSENTTDNSTENMGCTFDDNLLVVGSSNESSNDYSAFQQSSAFKWSDNQVPFFFRSNMQENDKLQIRNAMITMQENTCITFFEHYQEDTVPPHHLAVSIDYEPQDCSQGNGGVVRHSEVAEQLTLSFTYGFECGNWAKLILHELGHVVGLAHTQKRPDSDQFIQVNYNCIQQGKERQFHPLNENDVDTFGVPYKCNSMMHYNENVFSNGCPTISAQQGQCEDGIGGNGPIPEDWELINKAYNCPM